jgi:hypothetical protein
MEKKKLFRSSLCRDLKEMLSSCLLCLEFFQFAKQCEALQRRHHWSHHLTRDLKARATSLTFSAHLVRSSFLLPSHQQHITQQLDSASPAS